MKFFKNNIDYDLFPYENGLDIMQDIRKEKEAHEIRMQKLYEELQKEKKEFKNKINTIPITLNFGPYSCEVLGNKIKYYIEKEVVETINLSKIINIPYEYEYCYIKGGYGNQYFYKYNINSTLNLKNNFSVQIYNSSEFLENTEQILNNVCPEQLLYFSDINEIYYVTLNKNLIKLNNINLKDINLETTKTTIKKELVTLKQWRKSNV